MDALSLFGLFAVTAALICYAMEARSHWWTLGFVAACVLGSIYGFLQGAWPFGLVEIALGHRLPAAVAQDDPRPGGQTFGMTKSYTQPPVV